VRWGGWAGTCSSGVPRGGGRRDAAPGGSTGSGPADVGRGQHPGTCVPRVTRLRPTGAARLAQRFQRLLPSFSCGSWGTRRRGPEYPVQTQLALAPMGAAGQNEMRPGAGRADGRNAVLHDLAWYRFRPSGQTYRLARSAAEEGIPQKLGGVRRDCASSLRQRDLSAGGSNVELGGARRQAPHGVQVIAHGAHVTAQ
jgi:hypothetical protein